VRNLVIKLHIYAGLLTFAQLMIYGVAGLVATFAQPERPKTAHTVRYVPFTAAPSATDRQVADAVYATLALPLTRPMPGWYLRHTAENDLLLDFYNINGIWRVVVLEREHRLRIEAIRNSTWLFLSDAHAATTGDAEAPPVVRVWGFYNDFAMWCLLAFCMSGVYLWLASEPRWWYAWAALGAGAFAMAALWLTFR
jgi:hypothetical protein